MKKITTLIFLLSFYWATAQNLKPYVEGFETMESVTSIQEKIVKILESNGLKVVGQYQPANDKNRAAIIFTSLEIENAIKKVGGLTGFAATLRIGITSENGKTVVSYTNPFYWGNAYFRTDFESVSNNYSALNEQIIKTMKSAGEFIGKPFGSKNGLSEKSLRKYHYMMAMPYFDDVIELAHFDSYDAAIAKIDANFRKGIADVKQVSKVVIPGKKIALYNVALLGEKGESKFLPVIDIAQPKHTASLPYEILVTDNRVVMLHGRYRIALSFPDLTMGTFVKIMSTPGDIENQLKQILK
jgi:hypothetical protein